MKIWQERKLTSWVTRIATYSRDLSLPWSGSNSKAVSLNREFTLITQVHSEPECQKPPILHSTNVEVRHSNEINLWQGVGLTEKLGEELNSFYSYVKGIFPMPEI